MNGSKIPAAEWQWQDTGLSPLVESQQSTQRAFDEWGYTPTESGVSYGTEVDMRTSQREHVAHWPPATPCRWEDGISAFPSYIYQSQPSVSSREDSWNGYAMSYNGTNIIGPLLSFESSSQLKKRDWSKVDDSIRGFQDQSNDYLYTKDPQQKRSRVLTTTYQPARHLLGDDNQHPNQQNNIQEMDCTMHGPMEILEDWQDYMSAAPLCSTALAPSLLSETWVLAPQETLPGQATNQQTYQNGNGDASRPKGLDYKSILEGGDLFAYSHDVEPMAYHTTSFLGAAESCQTYSPLENPHCHGIADTAAIQNSAGPSQRDIIESEGESAEECRYSDAEERTHGECDTCFGMVRSFPLFRMRLACNKRMRGESHIYHLQTTYSWVGRTSVRHVVNSMFPFSTCAHFVMPLATVLIFDKATG
jgi:hypothetical protein